MSGLVLLSQSDQREKRDRLEVLEALIASPSFDPIFRPDIIRIPKNHPVIGWGCRIPGCDRPYLGQYTLCVNHRSEWLEVQPRGVTMAEFTRSATPLQPRKQQSPHACAICGDNQPTVGMQELCYRHQNRWHNYLRNRRVAKDQYDTWLALQTPYENMGECRVACCDVKAAVHPGLCTDHYRQFRQDGHPGRLLASPRQAYPPYDPKTLAVWLTRQVPIVRVGRINLIGLAPLLRAEIKYGLYAHSVDRDHGWWGAHWVQYLANDHRELGSLRELNLSAMSPQRRRMLLDMLGSLRVVTTTKADTRSAGYVELDHFGIRFRNRRSQFMLNATSQTWLRNLLWDFVAANLENPAGSRSAGPYDAVRRSVLEFGTYLEQCAPKGGHDPALLGAEHVSAFVADQKTRMVNGTKSRSVRLTSGEALPITPTTLRFTLSHIRRFMRWALDEGHTEKLGLTRVFIVAFPQGEVVKARIRNPFTDDVAKAVADEANLSLLERKWDQHDRGLRTIWETIVFTGRRVGEVLNLRVDCLGRYNGLPLLWHDQTKVGNYGEAVRIPEDTYRKLQARQDATKRLFEARFGRPPTAAECKTVSLFPTNMRNPHLERSVSYTWFRTCFGEWVDELDLGDLVTHQARHTIATKLLGAGASMRQIKDYLGHVSERMSEHYAKITNSDLEEALQTVWVAGPGSRVPGEQLSGLTPMTRAEAHRIAIDLSRKSTPAEGGFCTFQPVVNGDVCPWKLNCEGCEHYVISGADLLYWRRKREQWALLAERAPDEATTDYLHDVFAPTAQAVDGLERALAALGLLDDALSLDLRRPQDYFNRLWNTAFRPLDLVADPPQVNVEDQQR